MKRWTRPCCQSEVRLPISYGNQCSRMQSIAKQVTLALTATLKNSYKPRGSGCSMGAKEMHKQCRGEPWSIRSVKHFGTCLDKRMNEKNCKLSCHYGITLALDNLFFSCTVSYSSPVVSRRLNPLP